MLGDSQTADAVQAICSAAGIVLGMPTIDADETLASQGLDSHMAQDLVSELDAANLHLRYTSVITGSARSLAVECSSGCCAMEGPTVGARATCPQELPLSGPQRIWAQLESRGYGAWANISLCVSIPSTVVPSAFLAAMAQALSDANDALRTSFVPSASTKSVATVQRIYPAAQLPVAIEVAPLSDHDALRRAREFEGEQCNPFERSARALVLASQETGQRNWLCLTLHHAFCDRAAMHSLLIQLNTMLTTKKLQVASPPALSYADYVRWSVDQHMADGDSKQSAAERLVSGLALPKVSLHLA